MEVAAELGDGVMTVGSGEPSFDWCSALVFGTVLDVRRGPGAGSRAGRLRAWRSPSYHAMYEGDLASVDGTAGRDRSGAPASRRSLPSNVTSRCTRIIWSGHGPNGRR